MSPAFMDVARRTGRLIGRRAGTLVFGSSDLGMMAEVARGCHAGGGKVIGVLPRTMHEQGWAFPDADETVVTGNLFDRKRVMIERADAFIALPGGFGTLDEVFDVIALRLLGYHDKPIAIVNADDFWSPLATLVDHLIAHRFAKPEHRRHYALVASPEAALAHLGAVSSARRSARTGL